MPTYLLMHLPLQDANRHALLAERALKPAHFFAKFTLIRVPSQRLRRAMRDLNSKEALCAQSHEALSPQFIKALRWAVHRRFRDVKRTHAQLRCDIVGGDESRLKTTHGKHR